MTTEREALLKLHEQVGEFLSENGACRESDTEETMCTWGDCRYCGMANTHEWIVKMLDKGQ